jgi:beta-1,4-galactosyltransferase 1
MILALIVPYRDRESNLRKFIPYITSTLCGQNINFKIIIVEQSPGKLFNRGLLCNIGFKFYQDECNYVVFHDVDMICHTIDYSYNNKPTSLLRYRSKSGYVYNEYFGGITLFPKNDFIKINGFSNNYWGWGAEDADLYHRCIIHNIKTETRQGFCRDLELIKDKQKIKNNPYYSKNLERLLSFQTDNKIPNEGLNTIISNKLFHINNIQQNNNYTKITVKI